MLPKRGEKKKRMLHLWTAKKKRESVIAPPYVLLQQRRKETFPCQIGAASLTIWAAYLYQEGHKDDYTCPHLSSGKYTCDHKTTHRNLEEKKALPGAKKYPRELRILKLILFLCEASALKINCIWVRVVPLMSLTGERLIDFSPPMSYAIPTSRAIRTEKVETVSDGSPVVVQQHKHSCPRGVTSSSVQCWLVRGTPFCCLSPSFTPCREFPLT